MTNETRRKNRKGKNARKQARRLIQDNYRGTKPVEEVSE